MIQEVNNSRSTNFCAYEIAFPRMSDSASWHQNCIPKSDHFPMTRATISDAFLYLGQYISQCFHLAAILPGLISLECSVQTHPRLSSAITASLTGAARNVVLCVWSALLHDSCRSLHWMDSTLLLHVPQFYCHVRHLCRKHWVTVPKLYLLRTCIPLPLF